MYIARGLSLVAAAEPLLLTPCSSACRRPYEFSHMGQYQRIASGRPPTKEERAERQAAAEASVREVCAAYERAYDEAAALGRLYTANALAVDFSDRGPPAIIEGGDAISARLRSSSQGVPRLTLLSAVPEGKVVYAEYRLEGGGKAAYRGAWRLTAGEGGALQIDEDVHGRLIEHLRCCSLLHGSVSARLSP